jgi:hypothetical protein
MCAGGIPEKNITNPVDVVTSALEMRSFIDKFEFGKRGSDKRIWELKTGIHTGPVTATATGRKKINYDIKGIPSILPAVLKQYLKMVPSLFQS